MTIIQTNIPGVLIIEPRVFNDSRGYFFESYSQMEFDEKVAPILGHRVNFVQDNESKSSYTNATSSIIPKPMVESISRTNHLALIGAYLLIRRYSVRKT